MIQTKISDGRGGYATIDHNDARYWEGPYTYQPFPKAVYRQTQPGEACEHRIVQSESELTRLGADWHESPVDAKAHFEALESDMAKEAAVHNYAVSRMSANAQAEAVAHARSTDEMTADVPAPKKRGRPAKQTETQ